MKKLMDFFKAPKPTQRTAAQVAKDRLQIIVSHESSRHHNDDFVEALQKELVAVISKYIDINEDSLKVQLDRHAGQSVLELNVTMSESDLERQTKETAEKATAEEPALAE